MYETLITPSGQTVSVSTRAWNDSSNPYVLIEALGEPGVGRLNRLIRENYLTKEDGEFIRFKVLEWLLDED